jgi:serine/threonine protein kinase
LLTRSRLFTGEEARAIYQRWQQETKGANESLVEFARWLTAKQYLTEYQGGLLTRGHSEGYFLNQYKILERIGRGRMAGVYRAVHTLGQVVAIKVLPPSRARDPQLLARFQREARLALRLAHPNIVQAYQVGEADGLTYLVMEYLEGETLDEVLQRRGRLPPAEAVRLVYQLLQGLQHMHEQGLVHRDLKPANLMLVPAAPAGGPDTTVQSTIKILDIGLGRVLYDETTTEKPQEPELTGAGTLLGTPDYMAPEQARDARSADIRSDIYSVGCVLFHLLAGEPPFPDTNLVSQMVRHATEPVRPLKELNPQLPDGLQQILDSMLAKQPSQRYATPQRAAEALEAFFASAVEPAAEVGPQLRSYLDWLRQTRSGDTATAPALPQAATNKQTPAVPPTTERPPTRPSVVPIPGKPAPAASKRPAPQAPAPRPARRKSRPAPPPPPADEPRGDEQFDVELIALGVGAPKPESEAGFHLTRRDFLMLGAGAGSVLAAVLFGWLLARLLRRTDKDEK